MKITRGKLKEVISEEVQKFVESLQEDILKEGQVSSTDLKKLLQELDQQDDNT